MLNSVSLIGHLGEIDKEEKRIRYLYVERFFSKYDGNIELDKIPIVNWNKEVKGEIFSFNEKSIVAIRGRIESLNNIVVIVVETIVYLGIKY